MRALSYFVIYCSNEQTHLEESINRHKAHIIKLELVLRLLDNDELSADEVMEVKDLVEDYVERNQVCISLLFICYYNSRVVNIWHALL